MRFVLLLMVAAFGALLVSPASESQAQAKRDWRGEVVRNDVSHFIGNPKARVTLVEYLSFTCPACRNFVSQSKADLRDGLVRDGQVRVEIRHAVRDRLDLAAATLARCAGPRNFVAIHDLIFANQAPLIAGAQAIGEDAYAGAATIGAQLLVTARESGLARIAAARGIDDAALVRCYADEAAIQRIAEGGRVAFEKISGTPSFEVDGVVLPQVHHWATLEPRLRARLAN